MLLFLPIGNVPSPRSSECIPPGNEPPWSFNFSMSFPMRMYSCGLTALLGWFSKNAMSVSMARRASSWEGGQVGETPLESGGGCGGGAMFEGLGERIGVVWWDW